MTQPSSVLHPDQIRYQTYLFFKESETTSFLNIVNICGIKGDIILQSANVSRRRPVFQRESYEFGTSYIHDMHVCWIYKTTHTCCIYTDKVLAGPARVKGGIMLLKTQLSGGEASSRERRRC